MATEVFTTEDIVLLDGEEVELRPLPIAKLRKFMRLWSDHMKNVSGKLTEASNDESEAPFTEADLTDAQFTTFIKMCALGLETQLKGEKSDKQFLTHLEDVLDEQTIYKILEVTGGLKFGGDSPNLNPAQMPGLDGTA